MHDAASDSTVYEGPDSAVVPSLVDELLTQLRSGTGEDALVTATGQGAWHPENDAHLWLKFNLRAHSMQAQTLQRRFGEADEFWARLDELTAEHRLPDRVCDPLFDAARGLSVQRSSDVKRLGLEERTATRDLSRLTDVGLLVAHGQTRGRYYLAGPRLQALYATIRNARRALEDPFPDLLSEIR